MDSRDRLQLPGPARPSQVPMSRHLAPDPALHLTGESESPVLPSLVPAAWRALARHRWHILSIWGAATAALLALVHVKVHPHYEAFSLVRIEPSRQDLFETGAHGSEVFATYLKTQIQLITSPNVLSAAAAEPRVAAIPAVRLSPDAEAELARRLDVKLVPESYLIRISKTSPSPADSATVVNAVVNAYMAATAEWTDGMTRSQIKTLENYQRELQDQADEKQESWLALAAKSNVNLVGLPAAAKAGADTSSTPATRITIEEFKRVRELVFKTDIELVEAQALLEVRKEELQVAERDPEREARLLRIARETFQTLPAVVVIVQEIERADQRLTKIARHAQQERSVDAHRLAEPRRAQATIPAILGGVSGVPDRALEGSRPRRPGRGLRDATDRVVSLKAARSGYEKILREIEVSNKQEGTDAVRVMMLRESLAGIKGMQDAVNRRLEQLRYESKGEARITRINQAQAAVLPLSDDRTKLMLLTPGGVLALVMGLFVFLEIKSDRVADLGRLSQRVPIDVYTVPPLPGLPPPPDSNPRGLRLHEARLQEFLNSLDHLRATLFETETAGDQGRCLVITSANSGEGKTTLTSQLAACCARAGASTLVIDGDLRRASLSQLLGHEGEPGLCDVLEGSLAAEKATVLVREGGFHLLPAGTTGTEPGRLLSGRRLARSSRRTGSGSRSSSSIRRRSCRSPTR